MHKNTMNCNETLSKWCKNKHGASKIIYTFETYQRSPEDDRGNRYGSQRRRSRNYDNYGSHNQVAAGYKDNNYQGDDQRNSGYHNYGREEYGNSKRSQSRESRDHNPSPDDMLNGPCHIHSALVDGKRVSRHAMKDCKTFLKLQEAVMRVDNHPVGNPKWKV
jgi:hypothetical protein